MLYTNTHLHHCKLIRYIVLLTFNVCMNIVRQFACVCQLNEHQIDCNKIRITQMNVTGQIYIRQRSLLQNSIPIYKVEQNGFAHSP